MINDNIDFKDLGIDTSAPGFYNDPIFLEIERKIPSILNEYNKFVMAKKYSDEYLIYARKKIDIVVDILFDELSKSDRFGACIDISQILMLILEKEGIWSCMFDGSMTIEYNEELKIKPTYFHTVDYGDYSAAHAWIAAPPYKIIDLSLSLQDYEYSEKQYLPKYVLTDNVTNAKIQPIDIVNPRLSLMSKKPLEEILDNFYGKNTYVLEFINNFPPVYVQSNKVKIKYIALRSGASDGQLESAKCLDFSGKTPFEIYEKKIKPKLKNIGI
ncbi:MAG: hypothetical protein LBI04_00875 [Treponema sp.]|jgi:hypothetical protein|nr:hypothetical protein [Treponema sp.]